MIVWGLSVFLLAICTFFPLLSAGFLMLDDSFLITSNPVVTSPSFGSVLQAFHSYDPELYIPLTLLSYQLDRIVGDFSPLMFHIQNILLHLGSGFLVFWLLALLTRSRKIAGCTALVFLFHPVQTEAVSWLSARKDLLSSFFALATLVAYMSHRSLQGTARRDLYIVSVTLFCFALLSKVSVAVLPLILFLIDIPGKKGGRFSVQHLPFWLLSIIFIIIGLYGKTASFGHISPAMTVLIGCRAFLSLLGHIVLPLHLQPLYILHDWAIPSMTLFVSALLVLVLLVCTLFSLQRGLLIGRLFSAVFVLLLPIGVTFWKDGVVYLPSDRYAYLALIPLTLIVLHLCERASLKCRCRVPMFVTSILAGFFILLTASLTHVQARLWQTDQSLFSHVLALEPKSHVALNNMGNVERAQGNVEGAIMYYQRAISAKPDFIIAYRNAGSAFLAQKNFLRASQYYRHSLALSSENPLGYHGLGVVLLESKQYALSRRAFERAIALDPQFIDAYIGLGGVYYAEKDPKGERAVYERGLSSNPGDPSLLQNLRVLKRETRE